MTTKTIIKTPDELVKCVMNEYLKLDTELTESFFEGFIVSMTKADFMRAYAKIQENCNGDVVVRLDSNLNVMDELIPREWERTMVGGDAKFILLDINAARLENGPIFARYDNDDLLDLVYGDFNINKPYMG